MFVWQYISNPTDRQGLWCVALLGFLLYAAQQRITTKSKGTIMTEALIYLAGPITGKTYTGCTDWREHFVQNAPAGLVGLSPMRSKQYLRQETSVADQYTESLLSCQRGIFARDSWDTHRCDALLVNLLGADRVSIGTVMEIAWAQAARKPIVLVMEKEGNIHEHAMLREACPFRVETLEEAYATLSALFDVSVPH